MRITVLTGSVPNTTFVDAMINTMASEGYDMTVIGKRTGDYKYAKNVQVIELPGTRWGNVLLIIWLLISTGFRHLKRIMKESKDLASLYSNLLFYLPHVAINRKFSNLIRETLYQSNLLLQKCQMTSRAQLAFFKN